MEVSGQLHAPAALSSEMEPGIHFIWGWVDPRACLDVVEKEKFLALTGFELLMVQPVTELLSWLLGVLLETRIDSES
jgi:hypothetical protein